MRTLIYAHAFAPSIGGAQTYAMLLAQGLAAEGRNARNEIDVELVTKTAADGFDDATLPFRVIRRPRLPALWLLVGKTDLIHLVGPAFLPLLLGLVRGRPVVIEHHGYQAVCPNGLLFFQVTKSNCPGHFMARRYLECIRCNARSSGWVQSLARLVVTFPRRWMCTRATVNMPITRHVDRRLRLPRSRVVYYGLPDEAPAPDDASGPATFAYVGRLVEEKGLPVLIKAARKLREGGADFSVRFIGDGPDRRELETLAEKNLLGDVTEFTGLLRGERLKQELRGITAVVMPSVMEETAGLAAIQQMMSGRLVIASDIGGIAEVVDGAGFLFPPGDDDALASCMLQAIRDPDASSRLGAAARDRARRYFGLERMISEHLAIYRDVIERRA
jgi:glycosyltransferase involved in cell wall biosynthesis